MGINLTPEASAAWAEDKQKLHVLQKELCTLDKKVLRDSHTHQQAIDNIVAKKESWYAGITNMIEVRSIACNPREQNTHAFKGFLHIPCW